MYIGLHVKCQLVLLEFNGTGVFWTDFLKKKKRKNLNIKFHKNASSASRVVACGPTDRHEETNSRSTHFANPPEKKVTVRVSV